MDNGAKRRVTIVGGGVAALEALLALRSLTGDLASVELVADTPRVQLPAARGR